MENKNKNQKENKSNKGNKNKNVKIIDGNDEIILKQDKKNEDYMLIEKSTIISQKKIQFVIIQKIVLMEKNQLFGFILIFNLIFILMIINNK